MTDSDSDQSNIFEPFQNGQTSVCIKGPNINTNLTYRSQMSNYGRPKYAASIGEQRSLYYGRETSPMSVYSARDMRQRNFERSRYAESVNEQHSMYKPRETSPSIYSNSGSRQRNFHSYHRGMSSTRSMYNGRRGSPTMSMMSSTSAKEVIQALENCQFDTLNSTEIMMIKDTYKRTVLQCERKGVEKRRKLRLLKLKRKMNNDATDDSDEPDSDSLLSNEDSRSVKTYAGHTTSTRSSKENAPNILAKTTEMADLRKRDNNMTEDFTENIRQNTFRNMFSVKSNINNSINFNSTVSSISKGNLVAQKDRFRNGFALPYQRFNRSLSDASLIHKKPEITRNIEKTRSYQKKQEIGCVDIASDEEIFSARPESETNNKIHHKRNLGSEDESGFPSKKKIKHMSPAKNMSRNNKIPSMSETSFSNNNIQSANNFEFAKPTLPVRKSKPKVQEMLISKSAPSVSDLICPLPNKYHLTAEVLPSNPTEENASENPTQAEQNMTQNSDVSMHPSFIKRKLFTQQLDVTEKANLSADAINSPQGNMYSMIQKEKNKTRKLVTNQSCLNRDVTDNNLLELIHKIVRPDQINITNQTVNEVTKNRNVDDRWDVTSVLSMCNENEVSDTYTDEEIFADKSSKKDPNNIKNKKSEVKADNLKYVRVVLEKMPNIDTIQVPVDTKNKNVDVTIPNATRTQIAAKSFWDLDSESDVEWQHPQKDKGNMLNVNVPHQVKHVKDNLKYSETKTSTLSKEAVNDKTITETTFNNTVDNTRKFNLSTLSLRSHRIPKKKKCFNETCLTDLENLKKGLIQNGTLSNNILKSKITDSDLDYQNPKQAMKQTKKNDNIKANQINENFGSGIKKPNKKQAVKHKHQDEIKADKIIANSGNPVKTLKISNAKVDKHVKNTMTNPTTKRNKAEDTMNMNTATQSNEKRLKHTNIKVHKENINKNKPKSDAQNKSIPDLQNYEDKENIVKSGKTNYKKQYKNVTSKKAVLNVSPKINIKSKSEDKYRSPKKNKVSSKAPKTKCNDMAPTDLKDGLSTTSRRSRSQNKTTELNNTTEYIPKISRPIRSCRTSSQNRPTEINKTIQSVAKNNRPIRSCRTPSQNRSTELTTLSDSNVSCGQTKSLRSRVINLSSSIENITFSVNPRNRNVKNYNESSIWTRKSDVSFSLNDNTPIKAVAIKKNISKGRG